MLKKFSIILISIILILGICSNVNAAELKTSLDVIQSSSETKYLENDQGFVSKTIVDSNANTGEVTIELKLSNTKKEVETNKGTEVFLVLDNSISMDYNSNQNSTRKSIVVNSAKKLISKIYDSSSNVKIGIVRFASKWSGTESSTGKTYNQPNAANLMCELTTNKSSALNAISEYSNIDTEAGTNIFAGLLKAYQNFSSENTNKIIIILTDGVPTEYTESYYDMDSKSSVYSKTKSALKSIGDKFNLITMLTGISSDSEDIEDQNAAEEIFGTPQNPTAGKFYNISDTDIEKVISEDIFNNVMEVIQNPINTTKIVDYFPEEITDNFTFSYVGNPSIGKASDTIDAETKTITWNIGTLKGEDVATLKYKLKIKDMKNTELLNKTIATNEKVVLTYKDADSKDYTVTLTNSPKIQLSEIKEKLTATVSYNPTGSTTGSVVAIIKTNKRVNSVEGWTLSQDGQTLTKTYYVNGTEKVHLIDLDGMTADVEVKVTNIVKEEPKNDNKPTTPKDDTVVNGKLPQTGANTAVTIISVIGVMLIAIVMYKKYRSYKDIK